MPNFVGNVLKVNFVSGPNYDKDAAKSAQEAAASAQEALDSATRAATSEVNAANKAIEAANSSASASSSATQAYQFKIEAQVAATNAGRSADQALGYANIARESVPAINGMEEWIRQHNDAFALQGFGLLDNDGDLLLDNDGVQFGGEIYYPITDPTLTLVGVPADAYAVGVALQQIRDLIASYHPSN